MAEAKTKKTTESVEDFLHGTTTGDRKADCLTLVKIMKQATKVEPRMWGPAIVGFGSYHYKYASGREGDWPIVAFSPRKQNLTIYLMPGFASRGALLEKLGKHKAAVACLYVKSLADIDLKVLKELVVDSVKETKAKHS